MFRVGIMGAGNIAVKMAATLNAMEGAEAYAVASRDKDKAEEFATRHSVRKAYGSYQELVEDKEIDLVYVATPHSCHYEHVRLCLMNGKAVLCEKSFVMDARQAEELVSLSRERNVFLAEAIWTRYMPFSATIRDIVSEGLIGRPMMLTANLGYPIGDVPRILSPQLGGGALLDLGVYLLNFSLMCFGDDIADIASVCTMAHTGVDLQDSITLRYRDGKMAVLQATALCANDRMGVISGDKGYLVVDNINNPLKADLYSDRNEYVKSFHAPEQITGFEYQVKACMDAIGAGMIETCFMPHSESVKVMRMMDSIREQWRQ